MECCGGNGYVEELPLARLYREVPVNAIWEGSGNVMALDLLRVLQREPEVAGTVMEELAQAIGEDAPLKAAHARVQSILHDPRLLDVRARTLVEGLALRIHAGDVLTAPAAINLNYFSDLIRLPGRQAELFLESLTARPAIRARFDPAHYEGPHFDRVRTIKLLDGRSVDKDVTLAASDLDARFEERMAGEAPFHVLPGPLARLEYRYPRAYLRRMEEAAGRSGAGAGALGVADGQ